MLKSNYLAQKKNNMRYINLYETFTNKVVIGIDIDGTISNFGDAFNLIYKRYYPDREVYPVDDWYWYRKMDFDGQNPEKWMYTKKAETFEIAQPYPDAANTINNIYDFVKTHGHTLKIVTHQPTTAAKEAAKIWVDKYGFKYDDIIFVNEAKEKWKYADIMVDDADKVIGTKPLSKVCIKVDQLWNQKTEGDFNITNIKGLTIDIVKQAINKLKNKTTL